MPALYELRIKGRLDSSWSDWLEGLSVTPLDADETLISGPLADQSALHGLLARIRDLNLELISVEKKQEA